MAKWQQLYTEQPDNSLLFKRKIGNDSSQVLKHVVRLLHTQYELCRPMRLTFLSEVIFDTNSISNDVSLSAIHPTN